MKLSLCFQGHYVHHLLRIFAFCNIFENTGCWVWNNRFTLNSIKLSNTERIAVIKADGGHDS